MMSDMVLNFTVLELLAFLGLAQSVYILVYIFFRSNNFSRAIFPTLFFLAMCGSFFITVAQSQWQIPQIYYNKIAWLFWTMCAPLSSLLAIQIARITKPPPLLLFPVLFSVPFGFGLSYFMEQKYNVGMVDALYVSGIIIGALSLLVVWVKRDSLDKLHKRKNGKERFWLIISFILLNICLLGLNFLFIGDGYNYTDIALIRIIIGLSFLYIASTSLFRIYPPVVSVPTKNSGGRENLSDHDIEKALEIENLLHMQKVYQEPSYGRSHMAKELSITEAQLSRIVNGYFQKNVPLLLNELRVDEAKMFLKQTKVDIATVADESGFNSIATFNRVFKEMVRLSPKQFREK
jgi:AraC-like DNA-binding protein